MISVTWFYLFSYLNLLELHSWLVRHKDMLMTGTAVYLCCCSAYLMQFGHIMLHLLVHVANFIISFLPESNQIG